MLATKPQATAKAMSGPPVKSVIEGRLSEILQTLHDLNVDGDGKLQGDGKIYCEAWVKVIALLELDVTATQVLTTTI